MTLAVVADKCRRSFLRNESCYELFAEAEILACSPIMLNDFRAQLCVPELQRDFDLFLGITSITED